jgi:hypothetical protein
MKKNSNNNIDKKLSGKGDLSVKDKLKKLASETGPEEFDLDLGTLYDEYKESGFNGTFNEYLDKIGDDKVRTIKLSGGGNAESLAELYDAYEKGIDVMPGETISQYVKRIRNLEDK